MSLNHDEHLASKAIESESYEEALRLLQPLAQRNSEYALLLLGWIYETGVTGPSDLDAAHFYYSRAISLGSAAGCFNLGRVLLRQADEAKARAAFRIGAEREDMASMSELGRMMLEGRGGPSNPEEGWAWLEKAAGMGHLFAQRTLLGIEDNNARTVFGKMLVKLKILRLSLHAGIEAFRDARSDKLR